MKKTDPRLIENTPVFRIHRNDNSTCWRYGRSRALLTLSSLIVLSTACLAMPQPKGDAASDVTDINGLTRRPDGTPLPQCHVVLHNLANGGRQDVVSDDTGRFLFREVNPGRYELYASKPGMLTSPAKLVQTPTTDSAVELTLDLQAPSKEETAGATAPGTQEPERRALPAPLDGIFPSSEYLGPTIGVPDTDPTWPLTRAIWDQAPALEKAKIKIYGWLNPGGVASTSTNSNVPESYAIVPNRVEMDQGSSGSNVFPIQFRRIT